MRKWKNLNKYPSVSYLLEKKFIDLLLRYTNDQLRVFDVLILPKRKFNFISSLLRLTPEEFLEIAQNFKTLKIQRHGMNQVKITLKR